MKIENELAKNSIIFGIGIFGAKAIQFFLIPLYTMYMTTADYSVADLMISSITLVAPLLTLGIGNGILRFVLGNDCNKGCALSLSLLMCITSTMLLFLFSPFFRRIEMFSEWGYFIPFLYFVYTAKSILSQYCKAIGKNIIYAADGIISSFCLTFISIILIAVFKLEILGYLLSVALSNIVSLIWLMCKCHVLITLKQAKIEKSLAVEMVKYSLPLVPNELCWWIIQMSDRYMVTFFCGSELNGLYSMAYKIPSVFNLIVSVFIQAFGITAIVECDSGKKVKGKIDCCRFNDIYRNYLAISFSVGAVLILASRPIAWLILKNSFYEAWIYIPWLLCAYIVGNLQSFYGSIFAGIKKTNILMISTILGAIFNIILNFLLIPLFGAHGAAYATIVSYIVVYFVRLITIRTYVEMKHEKDRIVISIIFIILESIMYCRGTTLSIICSTVATFLIMAVFAREIVEMFRLVFEKMIKIVGSKNNN